MEDFATYHEAINGHSVGKAALTAVTPTLSSSECVFLFLAYYKDTKRGDVQ